MRLSIIIPVYNEEKEIETTVRQFGPLKIPHEVIVTDTLSTDKTVEIAAKCADKVIKMAATDIRGVSKGRNNGALASSGDFLVFIDNGTTIPDPEAFFTKALARFERDPKLVGLSCRVEVDPKVRTFSDGAVYDLMNGYFYFMNSVFNLGLAAGKFMMIKKTDFVKLKGFDEKLSTAEDIDFFDRAAKLGRVRIEWGLVVYHSGRRFHQQGAWKTLYRWIKNAIVFRVAKKPSKDVWEPIR